MRKLTCLYFKKIFHFIPHKSTFLQADVWKSSPAPIELRTLLLLTLSLRLCLRDNWSRLPLKVMAYGKSIIFFQAQFKRLRFWVIMICDSVVGGNLKSEGFGDGCALLELCHHQARAHESVHRAQGKPLKMNHATSGVLHYSHNMNIQVWYFFKLLDIPIFTPNLLIALIASSILTVS